LKITTVIKTWLLLAAGLMSVQSTALAEAARVAIIPFQINADQDYTFLQKGIVDMLSSRLSAPTVEVIDPLTTAKVLEQVKAFKGDSMVLMAAAKLKADLAIHGSITVLGGSVSIDAKVLDVTGTRPPLNFYKQTQGMDEVIPQINRLATEINTTVLGRPAPVAALEPPKAAPMTAAEPQSPEDIHMHPEKLLQNGHLAQESGGVPIIGGPPQGTASPLNPAFESTMASATGSRGKDFWKSRNFKYLINGMDVGDVNHDGLIETVLATPEQIIIYQFSQGRMQEIAKIDTSGRYNIGVDVGDINGNGTPEIFITSLNSLHNILDSQVVEFDGQTFKPIIKDARWYFRVVQHPIRGLLLLGQRQKAGGADPLSSPIFELAWNGTDYIEGTRVLPDRKANLLSVAYGDFRNDKTDTIVAVNASDKLRLYNLNGQEVWTSTEYYGGSPISFSLPPDGPGDMQKLFFIPTRTRLVDLDGDQKIEALVAQNIDSSNRKLSQQRFYNSSRIMALVWDGLGLTPAWQTRKISGRIQDLAVADFDNDGQNELLAVVVSKEGRFIGTHAQSALIAYDLSKK
jgi:TolB-like protein